MTMKISTLTMAWHTTSPTSNLYKMKSTSTNTNNNNNNKPKTTPTKTPKPATRQPAARPYEVPTGQPHSYPSSTLYEGGQGTTFITFIFFLTSHSQSSPPLNY